MYIYIYICIYIYVYIYMYISSKPWIFPWFLWGFPVIFPIFPIDRRRIWSKPQALNECVHQTWSAPAQQGPSAEKWKFEAGVWVKMVPKTLQYFENGPCVDLSISSADSPWSNYPTDGIPVCGQKLGDAHWFQSMEWNGSQSPPAFSRRRKKNTRIGLL